MDYSKDDWRVLGDIILYIRVPTRRAGYKVWNVLCVSYYALGTIRAIRDRCWYAEFCEKNALVLRTLLARCGFAPPPTHGGMSLFTCVCDHAYALEEFARAEFNIAMVNALNIWRKHMRLPRDADSLISIIVASRKIRKARAALIVYRYMRREGGCPILGLIEVTDADHPRPGTLRWSAYMASINRLRSITPWRPASCFDELKDLKKILEPAL